MLGAKISSSALLDATDMTGPSLFSIGEDAVIAGVVLLQSHEVKNEFLRLSPIRIGQRSFVVTYAVIQKGNTVVDGAEVLGLNTSVEGKNSMVNAKTQDTHKGKEKMIRKTCKSETLIQFIGIYMVGFLSSNWIFDLHLYNRERTLIAAFWILLLISSLSLVTLHVSHILCYV